WTYAGNLGLAQGLESAIDAAALLGEGYHLLLMGEGPRQNSLRQRAAALPEASVELRDPVPADDAARLVCGSDGLLVSLADSPGLDGTVPSKLYDCCAM